MLVPMPRLLDAAARENYALIAPDFLTLNMLELELDIAQALNTPVILSYPAMALDRFRPFRSWTQKLLDRCRNADLPVCLHLDHGKSVKACLRAIEAGFTSVMIDGSAHDFETNVAMTRAVVRAAKKQEVSVEGEIGHVGSGQGVVEKSRIETRLTRPEEAQHFAQRTGVDALAVSVGTCHGLYRGEPHIDRNRLAAINQQVEIPLVLHGGSGTGRENLEMAVGLGIRKINLFTEFFHPYVAESWKYLGKHPWGIFAPAEKRRRQRTVLEPILKKYFQVSGSLGKAKGI